MKNIHWIVVVIVVGVIVWMVVLSDRVSSRDSFEDYVEWCEEKVEKRVVLYSFSIISKPDTLPNGYIGYMGGYKSECRFYDMGSYYLNEALKEDRWVRDVSSSIVIETEARCEPSLNGYQTWKQNK